MSDERRADEGSGQSADQVPAIPSGSKQARGLRPRKGRKPVDPQTGQAVKRTPFAIALGQRLKGARVGSDPDNPLFDLHEVVKVMNELTPMPWNERTLTSWENGYAVPPIEKLLALADFYHASLDHLVRGQEADDIHIEQVLDKLPVSLRLPMFALLNNPDLTKAVAEVGRLPEGERKLAADITAALSNLTEANLQMLQNLAKQLSEVNKVTS